MERPIYTVIRTYVDGEAFVTCRTTNEHYASFILEDEAQIMCKYPPDMRHYPGAILTLTLKKNKDTIKVIHGFDTDNEVTVND